MIATVANQLASKGEQLLSRGTVLVVDNDLKDLHLFSAILGQQGYEVCPFASYAEAEHCIESERVDFVVVNQGSPAFEARPLVERILMIDRHTPVLVVTRSLDMGCYLEAMQLGAVDYLEKPITPADLFRVLETHLPRPDSRRAVTPRELKASVAVR